MASIDLEQARARTAFAGEQGRQRVKILAKDVESIGLTVWWDRDIVAGARYRDTILTELNRARAVVVLWSPHSVRSDFVEDEAEHAKQAGKLIPLRTLNLDVRNIPLGFGSRQTLLVDDFSGVARALVPFLPKATCSALEHRRPIDLSRPQALIDVVSAAVFDVRLQGLNVTLASALSSRYGARIVTALEDICYECAERKTPRVIVRVLSNKRNPVSQIIVDLFKAPHKISSKIKPPAVPYELDFQNNGWESYVLCSLNDQRSLIYANGLEQTIENLVGTPGNHTQFRKILKNLLAATPSDQRDVLLRCPVRSGHPDLAVCQAALNGGQALIIKQEGWKFFSLHKFSVVGIAVD